MNKKRHEVIEELKQLIKAKSCTKDGKLPAERELATRLGVSRTLLREAIITLEAWGVLELRERQGIFVVAPDLCDFTGSMAFMSFWHEDLLSQVMEMRWLLNVAAAELSAIRRTDEDLTKMRRCIEALEKSGPETEEDKQQRAYWENNLHNLYIKAAHNTIMERVNEGLASIIERNVTLGSLMFMGIDDWFDTVVSQHKQLVKAIEEQNSRKAKAIMIQHLEDSIEKIEKLQKDGRVLPGFKKPNHTRPNTPI